MQDFLNRLSHLVLSDIDWITAIKFVLFFTVVVFLIGYLAKRLFGRDSLLNRALCASIGILFIYAVTIVVYTFNPAGLSKFLTPLPYVAFSGNQLYLFVFEGTQLSVICSQILSMLILSYLYHVLDDFMPEGIGGHWLLYRVLTILMAMVLHYVATWALNTFVAGSVFTHATTILVIVLIVFFLLGVIKFLLGVVLTFASPILGAIYTFFFSSQIGKQLTRALLTTLLLSLFVICLHLLGHSVIAVGASALSAYIPFALILLGIWFGFSRLL